MDHPFTVATPILAINMLHTNSPIDDPIHVMSSMATTFLFPEYELIIPITDDMNNNIMLHCTK